MKYPAFVPSAIKQHVEKLLAGKTRHQGKNTITYFDVTARSGDYKTIERLISDKSMRQVWVATKSHNLSDAQLTILFDAAWQAAKDYTSFRLAKNGAPKKSQVEKYAKKIALQADTLIDLINKFNGIWPFNPRYPDNHLQYPYVIEELHKISGIARNFDSSKISGHNFINAALSKQASNKKTEYMLAFLTLLKEKSFPIHKRLILDLLANIATVTIDHKDISYTGKDVSDIIRNSKHFNKNKKS